MRKWTVEPGRGIARNGVVVVNVTRIVDRDGNAPLSLAEADALTHTIVAALNREDSAS